MIIAEVVPDQYITGGFKIRNDRKIINYRGDACCHW